MNNSARLIALNRARDRALAWAEQAETAYSQNATYLQQVMPMAVMWAHVAEALKVGDHYADQTIRTTGSTGSTGR